MCVCIVGILQRSYFMHIWERNEMTVERGGEEENKCCFIGEVFYMTYLSRELIGRPFGCRLCSTDSHNHTVRTAAK